jgi:hypothetical protein
MNNLCNNELLEKIVYLSKIIDVMLFNRSIDSKWTIKSQHEIINILNNKTNMMHETLCYQLKILNQSKKYDKGINVLLNHQDKLMCISNLRKLIHTFMISKICVIEMFSNDDD